MICLDTNAAIALLSGEESPVRVRFRHAAALGESLVASSIVLFELWFGAEKSTRRDSNAQKIAGLVLGALNILDFDASDAKEAGNIRATLRRARTPIGPYDVLIAGQARRRGALLITANTREFARVPGLQIEDWTVPLN
jgi:tRNA(fMet)-specific endonuclease VapC